jgi:hypothetical protein
LTKIPFFSKSSSKPKVFNDINAGPHRVIALSLFAVLLGSISKGFTPNVAKALAKVNPPIPAPFIITG